MTTRPPSSFLRCCLRVPLRFLRASALKFCLCLLPALLHADDAFLRDYAETRGFMLGRPVAATPTPDGTAVLFLRAKGPREPSQELYEFTVADKQTRRLLAPEDALRGAAESLSPEEKARRERQRISVGGFTSFSISKDSALILLSLSGKLYVLHRADGKVTELTTGPGAIVDPKFTPDSQAVAYVRNQDVCLFNLAAGKEHAVTSGGTELLAHGLAEFVAQEEFNRFTGYWLSPDSKLVAFQENDASQVESWFVADPGEPGTPPERVAYPRPGKPNVAVRVGVTPAAGGGETVWLDWDRARLPYLGKVTWTADGPLTLTVLSRDQTDLALLEADPATGKTRVLLTEHDDAWVNLTQDVPVWLSEKDGGGFLWTTERAGGWQLERRTRDGSLDKILVPPAVGFRSLAGVARGQAYFLGNRQGPLASWLLQVALSGSDAADCPRTGDWNSATLGGQGPDAATLVNQTESLSRMPSTFVRRLPDGAAIAELPSIAAEPPFQPNRRNEEAGVGKVWSSCATIRPRDFNPESDRTYPVIVDVYGGPGHQQVTAARRTYLLDQWLADQGFIVVRMDGRGTPGHDRAWERAIGGHFGDVPLGDQIDALQNLGDRHPEMDLDRVGITGWSFGGYMSALAVMRRPDVFKAAVAGAPVVDWLDYDSAYTERYLGWPYDNLDLNHRGPRPLSVYEEGSLLTYADQLSRPLLLIHGTADDNVYFRHSLRLADTLFRAGKPFDFLPLSHFTHQVPDPVVRVRLEERIAAFFHAHLDAAGQ